MNKLLSKLEKYQAITGQEGENIDLLRLSLNCYFTQNKLLDFQDKNLITRINLDLLNTEKDFCKQASKLRAQRIIEELIGEIIKTD
ncbi:hypothetical protein MHO82_06755 [Vibrio sp. Of7-15]|uniref:hypothetical protein n=1 Tax=Vibrio sp. Of7-15 TaxID=2724879 RepID=UPI001EF1A3EC|nr:hypothetical protein [Vibrio sp. Of7-15]MCG7496555.1 hypothetical protein [Vibrio sp. Of7-15]